MTGNRRRLPEKKSSRRRGKERAERRSMSRSRSSPPSSYWRTAFVLKNRDAEVAEGATVQRKALGMTLEEASLLRAREDAIEPNSWRKHETMQRFQNTFCDCGWFLAEDEMAGWMWIALYRRQWKARELEKVLERNSVVDGSGRTQMRYFLVTGKLIF